MIGQWINTFNKISKKLITNCINYMK